MPQNSQKSPLSFPAALPKELAYLTSCATEESLLELLAKKTPDLLLFFEAASEDETWSEQHAGLMRKVIDWLTVQNFYDRLSSQDSLRIARVFQKHVALFKSLIPKNITIKLQDASIQMNSLLLATASDFFKDILARECRDKNKTVLSFNVPQELFIPIEEFINTGEDSSLLIKRQEEILALLHQAGSWGINDFAKQCELALKKFITTENSVQMLMMALQEQWQHFKQVCIDFINGQALGFELTSSSLEQLAFEFHDFSERTIAYFKMLRSWITDFICSGELTQDALFCELVKQCPKLALLNISASPDFSENWVELPHNLEGLNASQCPWVSQNTLKTLAEICPHIHTLMLCSNVQLNFADWGELLKFKELKLLDLSRCHQLSDKDLEIILKACAWLRGLVLDECKEVSDRGYFKLAKSTPRLSYLNIARCSISDIALIEIATRCRALTVLNVSRCDNLTERGVAESIKHAPMLKEIDIRRCNIPQRAIEDLRKRYPYLKIITG